MGVVMVVVAVMMMMMLLVTMLMTMLATMMMKKIMKVAALRKSRGGILLMPLGLNILMEDDDGRWK